MTNIICSKFGNKIPSFNIIGGKQIELNKYIACKFSTAKPLSCDEEYVFDGKIKIKILEFFDSNNDKLIQVLTIKEKSILLPFCVIKGIKIICLEIKFPIFTDIRYISNAEKNYGLLIAKIQYLLKIGEDPFNFHNNFIAKLQNKINKKIEKKSKFDRLFYFIQNQSIQEVYKFIEDRDNRVIFSLDFNSMYASCLEGTFINPSECYYELMNVNYNGEYLLPGIYRVILNNVNDDFFKKFHPFRYSEYIKSFPFELCKNEKVEIVLFHHELKYYSSYFESTHIIEAIVSKDSVYHPLYRTSLDLYKKRLKAKKNNRIELEKNYKLKLAQLHSATNKNVFIEKKFNYQRELVNYLLKEYGIDLYYGIKMLGFDIAIKMLPSGFSIYLKNNKLVLRARNLNNNSSVFSFSSQIVSNSRLKMFKLLEYLKKFNSLDICYVNIDSVHVSICSESKNNFLDYIKPYLSSDVGGLRIQCQGDKAAWFDVGRYYIYRDDKIIQYKNILFNYLNGQKPFVFKRTFPIVFKSENFKHVIKIEKFLKYNFSFSKNMHLGNDKKSVFYKRFKINEIVNADNCFFLETNEKKLSDENKFKKYIELAKKIK